MPGDIQRRERNQPNPATFLKLADDLAHENEYRQARRKERSNCCRAITVWLRAEQMLPYRKAHESDWRKHPNPIEGDGGACVTTYQEHDQGPNAKGQEYRTREGSVGASIDQLYGQGAAHPVAIGCRLHVLVCGHVGKRQSQTGRYLPEEI